VPERHTGERTIPVTGSIDSCDLCCTVHDKATTASKRLFNFESVWSFFTFRNFEEKHAKEKITVEV
jgi:hypothetical protein